MTTQPRPTPAQSEDFLPSEHALSKETLPVSASEFATKRTPTLDSSAPSSRRHRTNAPVLQRFPLRWFYDLPVRRKQMLALLCSELISVLGLVGVGSWLIVQGGRSQLVQQAKAELAATNIAYNIKVNQIGFSFRGQADNTAVVQAAKDYASWQAISPELRDRLKTVLASEIAAHNIEYATLVGNDSRIIVNANRDRTREKFDPEGLVSLVLANPRQIKANAIVSLAELKAEKPPMPLGFRPQNVLIRYVVTPVKDPDTGAVIGALVAGDIVNDKLPIVEETLQAFGNGYSAIYQRQPNGSFSLSTGLNLGDLTSLTLAKRGVEVSDAKLLKQTLAEKRVTRRTEIEGETYTVAAESLKDFQGKPIAILVRGTSEATLNQMLQKSLLLQLAIAALAITADLLLALLLGRSIVNPIEALRRVTQRFANDRQARAEVFANDEVGELTTSFNHLADNVAASEFLLKDTAEQERRVNTIVSRIRESVDRPTIFNITLEESRQALHADRMVIYAFDEEWGGKVVAEAVGQEWFPILGAFIDDPCFGQKYAQSYQGGRVKAIANIYEAGLTECYIRQLESLQARASLVAPILVKDKLLGLLIAYQCSRPRHWHEGEVNLLRQVAIQLGFALEQSDLFGEKEQARLFAERLSEEQRQQREALQMQLVELLDHVEGATRGDLTVRAEVTAGEIGTVADFFNAIIESLRQIVTKVKQSAEQVNLALGQNEQSVSLLAKEAIQQAEETTHVLDSIEQMNQSIYAVSESARQATEVARQAATTTEAGRVAMDLTTQNILNLRETVGETAKKVKRLGESSQQISRVVSMINQIAIQTNVLAINAGIEAARAGEEGQGFAVITEEVRELAVRSATATQEIEKIVANIQRETSLVVNAMEQSTTQVVEGTEFVENAKQSLDQIFEVSHQIDQLVQSISVATIAQVETSGVIANLMKDMAQTSERTSESSREVSVAIQQTAAIAQELQESVGAFHVGDA
jgi:twitching motility protein PilJ